MFAAISNRQGRHKPWLALFTVICVIATSLLWFTEPKTTSIYLTLLLVVLGTIGFEVGMVFYNAMLDHLVDKTYLGRLSGWGWGFGYVGGLLGLIVFLFGFKVNTIDEIRMVGPFAALWFVVFGWPLFAFTKEAPSKKVLMWPAIREGIRSLLQTLRSAREHSNVFLFLLARMFYIDGLNTVFAFGGIYAAGTFGMSLTEVIQFGIAMNVAAGLGAMLFAWLDDLRGSKITLFLSIIIMFVCGFAVIIVHQKTLFWLFGLGLSLAVGPMQSASRSFLIRLSPSHLVTEFFGLYAFSGKATTFLGPMILAYLTSAFHSQRVGMTTILGLLLIGGCLLSFVKEK